MASDDLDPQVSDLIGQEREEQYMRRLLAAIKDGSVDVEFNEDGRPVITRVGDVKKGDPAFRQTVERWDLEIDYNDRPGLVNAERQANNGTLSQRDRINVVLGAGDHEGYLATLFEMMKQAMLGRTPVEPTTPAVTAPILAQTTKAPAVDKVENKPATEETSTVDKTVKDKLRSPDVVDQKTMDFLNGLAVFAEHGIGDPYAAGEKPNNGKWAIINSSGKTTDPMYYATSTESATREEALRKADAFNRDVLGLNNDNNPKGDLGLSVKEVNGRHYVAVSETRLDKRLLDKESGLTLRDKLETAEQIRLVAAVPAPESAKTEPGNDLSALTDEELLKKARESAGKYSDAMVAPDGRTAGRQDEFYGILSEIENRGGVNIKGKTPDSYETLLLKNANLASEVATVEKISPPPSYFGIGPVAMLPPIQPVQVKELSDNSAEIKTTADALAKREEKILKQIGPIDALLEPEETSPSTKVDPLLASKPGNYFVDDPRNKEASSKGGIYDVLRDTVLPPSLVAAGARIGTQLKEAAEKAALENSPEIIAARRDFEQKVNKLPETPVIRARLASLEREPVNTTASEVAATTARIAPTVAIDSVPTISPEITDEPRRVDTALPIPDIKSAAPMPMPEEAVKTPAITPPPPALSEAVEVAPLPKVATQLPNPGFGGALDPMGFGTDTLQTSPTAIAANVSDTTAMNTTLAAAIATGGNATANPAVQVNNEVNVHVDSKERKKGDRANKKAANREDAILAQLTAMNERLAALEVENTELQASLAAARTENGTLQQRIIVKDDNALPPLAVAAVATATATSIPSQPLPPSPEVSETTPTATTSAPSNAPTAVPKSVSDFDMMIPPETPAQSEAITTAVAAPIEPKVEIETETKASVDFSRSIRLLSDMDVGTDATGDGKSVDITKKDKKITDAEIYRFMGTTSANSAEQSIQESRRTELREALGLNAGEKITADNTTLRRVMEFGYTPVNIQYFVDVLNTPTGGNVVQPQQAVATTATAPIETPGFQVTDQMKRALQSMDFGRNAANRSITGIPTLENRAYGDGKIDPVEADMLLNTSVSNPNMSQKNKNLGTIRSAIGLKAEDKITADQIRAIDEATTDITVSDPEHLANMINNEPGKISVPTQAQCFPVVQCQPCEPVCAPPPCEPSGHRGGRRNRR